MLADAGVGSLTEPFADVDGTRWSEATLRAVGDLNEESIRHVEAWLKSNPAHKSDCNFFACATELQRAGGLWSRAQCANSTSLDLVRGMLSRTAVDRQVHAHVLRRLSAALTAAERGGGPSLAERLKAVETAREAMTARRDTAMGQLGRSRPQLRSCVGCNPHAVPGIEGCWPSWEDQFSPDELKFWCKRAWTVGGYDATDLTAKHWPKHVAPIPCWRTCWEAMPGVPSGTDARRTNDTCLIAHGAPGATGDAAGGHCAAVHCGPACAPSGLRPSLEEFWNGYWLQLPEVQAVDDLNISCPCGPGG